MIAHPTPILQTTRSGSRSAIHQLNQLMGQRKGEPKRRKAGLELRPPRIVEPGAKRPSLQEAELDASPLLVILLYLLKNNITFMGVIGQVKMSPRQPLVTNFLRGGI